MAYTFDAAAKLVRCSSDTVEIELSDLWSRWKDWVLTGHAEVLRAFDTVGGDIAAIPLYLFPLNGWKIKLPEANRTVRVTGGILATADLSDPFANPDGAYTVRVEREAPAIAVGYVVETGVSGLTTEEAAKLDAAAAGDPVQATQVARVWQRLGLDPANPLVTNEPAGTIVAGDVSQTAVEGPAGVITITQAP